MSWTLENDYYVFEAQMSGQVTIRWICPRCQHLNVQVVDADELLHGTVQMVCQNTAECQGTNTRPQCTLSITGVQVSGSHNGLGDHPLNT